MVLLEQKRGTFIHKMMCKRTAVMMGAVFGSALQNKQYCLKTRPKDVAKGTAPNEEWWEFGECPTHLQGERSDLQEATALCKEKGIRAVVADPQLAHIAVRYPSGLRMVAQFSCKPRDFKTIVTVLKGPTGTGKSTAAANWPYPAAVTPPAKGQQMWFDPYDPLMHETIWIDDVKPGNIYKFGFLLRLLDRYPVTVPVKNGFVELRPKHIVITTSLHPRQWYPVLFAESPDEYAQLDRRIDYYIETVGLGRYEYIRGSPERLGMQMPVQEDMEQPPPLLPRPGRAYEEEMVRRRDEWLERQRQPRQ